MPQTHSLPPPAHETLPPFLPGLQNAINHAAHGIRRRGWDERRTFPPEKLLDLDEIESFLFSHGRREIRRGATAQQAATATNFVAHHVHVLLNFELHHRKLFWVDESVAWLLRNTRLNIVGRCLKLPFPSFAYVFTDGPTLEVGEKLLSLDPECKLRGRPLRVLSVYLTEGSGDDEATPITLSFYFDAGTGFEPYLVSRDLFVRPEDIFTKYSRATFPTWIPRNSTRFSAASELRQLVHLVVNSILYSTSADVEWKLLLSPVQKVARAARQRGKAKRQRVTQKVQLLKREHCSQEVFYLPSRIPISQVRKLHRLERSPSGQKLMSRFIGTRALEKSQSFLERPGSAVGPALLERS